LKFQRSWNTLVKQKSHFSEAARRDLASSSAAIAA
jgi:hypothetical protein